MFLLCGGVDTSFKTACFYSPGQGADTLLIIVTVPSDSPCYRGSDFH